MSQDNFGTDKFQSGKGPRRTLRQWLQSFMAKSGVPEEELMDSDEVVAWAETLSNHALREKAIITAKHLVGDHALPVEAIRLIQRLGAGGNAEYICHLPGGEEAIARKLLHLAGDPRAADHAVVVGSVVRIWIDVTLHGVRQYKTYLITPGRVQRLLDDDERLQGLDLSDPNPPTSASDDEDEWP